MLIRKNQIKFARWFFTFFVAGFFFYLAESNEHVVVNSGEPPVLYANSCHDNLEQLFCGAIKEAKESILLIIYSLNDTKLINALNAQAQKGVQIRVIHDQTTPPLGFRKLAPNIESQGIKLNGLMHQKILVIDAQKVLLGSANLTFESLRLHENLVIGLINSQFAEAICNQTPYLLFTAGNQECEYFSFPQKGKEGREKLIQLIDNAKKSIYVAMFTWTNPDLTEAVIRAHDRGIRVEVILDRGQATGVGHKTLEKLHKSGITVSVNSGLGLLHHKFVWIDEAYLVNGSANWTQAAFTRNWDCFLILHPLTEVQNAKMKKLWKKTKRVSQEVDDKSSLAYAA